MMIWMRSVNVSNVGVGCDSYTAIRDQKTHALDRQSAADCRRLIAQLKTPGPERSRVAS